MNLFVIYIGGTHEKALIELHDMRFVIAQTIEDTYSTLQKSWWGKPDSLHLDAWGCLRHSNGYDIQIKNEPSLDTKNKLYFINLGGYDKGQFTELHKNIFVVAEDEREAKTKAVQQISDWESPHRDYQFDVDKIMRVDSLIEKQDAFIHLSPSEKKLPFEFTCRYVPIGKNG